MSEPFDRDAVARENLGKLAVELRRLGVDAAPASGAHPFPGLLVAGSVIILAGHAHYWRYSREKHLDTVGSLDDPAATAREVHEHLGGRR